MAKITDAEFKAYLKEIREFIESDEIEEMQRECEVTNVFPQRFFNLCNEHQLFRISLPEEYGGWGLSEHQILQVQEEFSRGPGGMRMFIHFAQDLNWRPLYDFGSEELKAELMLQSHGFAQPRPAGGHSLYDISGICADWPRDACAVGFKRSETRTGHRIR